MAAEHFDCDCSETIFDACGMNGCMQCFQRFLEDGADLQSKNPMDIHETSLLHEAVTYYNEEIAECLIQHGVSPNIKNSFGETPMHTIANSDVGKNTIAIFVDLLIKNGGDINAKDEDGVTPLQTAILYKRLDVISFLIERGAHLDEKDNNGGTALHMAARQMNGVVITMLIRFGANPYEKDARGKTFLELMPISERSYFVDLMNEQECFEMKTPSE